MLSYEEFREKLSEELINRMPEHYRTGDYKVLIYDKSDNFGNESKWFKIVNKKRPLTKPPELSVDGAYENYLKTDDYDRIMDMIAITYDKAYSAREKEELPAVVAVTVNKEPGEAVYGVSDLYILDTGDVRSDVLLHGEDVLGRISEDEESGLCIIRLDETSCIAIPGDTPAEYRLCDDILNELKGAVPKLEKAEIAYFDRRDRSLVYGDDAVTERLKSLEKSKKHSIFNV